MSHSLPQMISGPTASIELDEGEMLALCQLANAVLLPDWSWENDLTLVTTDEGEISAVMLDRALPEADPFYRPATVFLIPLDPADPEGIWRWEALNQNGEVLIGSPNSGSFTQTCNLAAATLRHRAFVAQLGTYWVPQPLVKGMT